METEHWHSCSLELLYHLDREAFLMNLILAWLSTPGLWSEVLTVG